MISFFSGQTARVVGVMILTFVLAVIGTFGFYYSYELAAASFVLIVPLIFAQVLNIRLAYRLEREGMFGAPLRRALLRRRFWNQVLGMLSIVAIAGVAFVTFAPELCHLVLRAFLAARERLGAAPWIVSPPFSLQT